jgi:hypothetical protein
VFVARAVCSDPVCPAAFEARAAALGELDALVCDCDCALQVLGWPDALEEPAAALEVVMVR